MYANMDSNYFAEFEMNTQKFGNEIHLTSITCIMAINKMRYNTSLKCYNLMKKTAAESKCNFKNQKT